MSRKGDDWGGRAGRQLILDNLRARASPGYPGEDRFALVELSRDGRVNWPVDSSGLGYEWPRPQDAAQWVEVASAWGMLPCDPDRARLVRVRI